MNMYVTRKICLNFKVNYVENPHFQKKYWIVPNFINVGMYLYLYTFGKL